MLREAKSVTDRQTDRQTDGRRISDPYVPPMLQQGTQKCPYQDGLSNHNCTIALALQN